MHDPVLESADYEIAANSLVDIDVLNWMLWMAESGDYNDHVSGDQAVDALTDLMDPTSPSGADKRSHPRHRWRVPLTLVITEFTGQGESVREIKVTTCDLSQGGFAFMHRNFIAPGSEVRARLDSLPGSPLVAGVIRYCHLHEGVNHMVGVQFVQPPQIRQN